MTLGNHTVHSYDEELKRLENLVAEMGGLAEVQLAAAMEALIRRDSETALRIAISDERIDALEARIDQQAVTLLALRQPMAQDLREILGALKASSILERLGDYAKNVAKRTPAIIEYPPVPPVQSIARIGYLAQEMVKDVLDAYLARDVDKAEEVRKRDRELDALYTSVFRELLTYMMEDPRNITPATHILFVAKNLERVGDHATNLAEIVSFIVRGAIPTEERLKSDTTSYAVAEPVSRQPDEPREGKR